MRAALGDRAHDTNRIDRYDWAADFVPDWDALEDTAAQSHETQMQRLRAQALLMGDDDEEDGYDRIGSRKSGNGADGADGADSESIGRLRAQALLIGDDDEEDGYDRIGSRKSGYRADGASIEALRGLNAHVDAAGDHHYESIDDYRLVDEGDSVSVERPRAEASGVDVDNDNELLQAVVDTRTTVAKKDPGNSEDKPPKIPKRTPGRMFAEDGEPLTFKTEPDVKFETESGASVVANKPAVPPRTKFLSKEIVQDLRATAQPRESVVEEPMIYNDPSELDRDALLTKYSRMDVPPPPLPLPSGRSA